MLFSNAMMLAKAALVLVLLTAGRVSSFREPVRGYAGINGPWTQAVLVEPSPLESQQPYAALTSDGKRGRDASAVSSPHRSPQNEGDGNPEAAALVQSPHLGTTSARPLNGSRFLRQRLRQQGRRTGIRRKSVGGLNRRMHLGTARLRSGSNLAKRRRRPEGSQTSLDRWRNESEARRDALSNRAAILPSTSQPKINDFLSAWHRTYSRSQTRAGDNASESGLHKDAATEGDSMSIGPQESATVPKAVRGSFGAATMKKYTQNPTPQASVPSVHDMTSMHFKITDDSSSGIVVPNEMLKTDRNLPEKMTARTVDWFSSHDTKTTPLPTKRSVTGASPDGKEILDSIQSIFQASRTDESDLTSIKNVNHGNTSPQPLGVFSEASQLYGFIPSERIQSVGGPRESVRLSQTLLPPRALQDSKYPASWAFNRGPLVPGPMPRSREAVSNAPSPQRSSEPNLLLQLGHSIPVREHLSWGPEHREADEGGITLDGETSDEVIVGRPAALIQEPPKQVQALITAPPTSQMHPGVPPHILATEETAVEGSSPPARQELEPLLDYISNKYKQSHVKSIPSSVTSLQSIINTGRIPEFFRKDQVMDYIREDRLRHQQPPVDRVGEPWRNSIDRISVDPQAGESVIGGGQFVALSSLALLVAFCGYFLFATAGSSRESRGVLPPVRAAVDEAKNGLHLLLRGLDEYEDHISMEMEQSEDEKLIPVEGKNTTQEDIPTILKKIWHTVVPPEVRVTSGSISHVAGRPEIVNASSLVRSSASREKSVSRESYAREIPKAETNETRAEDETDHGPAIQPTLGLTSVANSFLNSLINSKAIKNIISQLKVPPSNIETPNQSASQEEIEESTPDRERDDSNSKLRQEFEDSMHQDIEGLDEAESHPGPETHPADGLIVFTGTGTRHGGLREVTEKSPRKRVILNNRLHVHHNPETDPPRTSAFVDNVPLKPLS